MKFDNERTTAASVQRNDVTRTDHMHLARARDANSLKSPSIGQLGGDSTERIGIKKRAKRVLRRLLPECNEDVSVLMKDCERGY